MRYSLSELEAENSFKVKTMQFDTPMIIVLATILTVFCSDWNIGAVSILCNYFSAVCMYNIVNIIIRKINYYQITISNNKVTLFKGRKTFEYNVDSIMVATPNNEDTEIKIVSFENDGVRLIIPVVDSENRLGNLK